MYHVLIAILVIQAVVTLPLSAVERDKLPLGHPEFYPSPERPIGWRGDGNGAFPGATMVDRFGDGPMAKIGVKVPDRFNKGKMLNRTWFYAGEGDPINIVWKHPLPGFTQSQPIVVGDRAIQTCEPNTVLCIDMRTGKQLWRQDIDILDIAGLTGDDLEKARLLESISWTLMALKASKIGNYGRVTVTEESLGKYTGSLDQLIAIAAQGKEHWPEAYQEMVKHSEIAKKGLHKLLETHPGKKTSAPKAYGKGLEKFQKEFVKLAGTVANCHWYSWVGWSWPTPVCDGTNLYGFFGQGQAYALSLEDGAVLWKKRLDTILHMKQPTPRSPLLLEDTLIIPWKSTRDKKVKDLDCVIYALDKKSGEELWKTPIKMSELCAFNPAIVTLKSGRRVLAFAEKDGHKACLVIIDPKDGAVLVRSEWIPGGNDPGESMVSYQDIAYHPYNQSAHRVIEGADGSISLKKLFTNRAMKGGHAALPLLESTLYSKEGSFDIQTGKMLLKTKAYWQSSWKPGIVVGERVIGSSKSCTSEGNLKTYGTRRLNVGEYYICTLDGKTTDGQEAGKLKRNFLQWESPPEGPNLVPQAHRFIKAGIITPNDILQINGGIPPNHGYGAMFAHANRVLIPHLTHLVCIGNPSEPYSVPKKE